ncbi:hypothetical protein SAMN02745129_0918 [Ferrimonas marina]|uniref:Uncharacterized protein n=1 Tax=Ferrimonas marina TaxID=299255 RepID=A0A1M5N6V3_9GAMM|nr:hypothetical protein SAMN02745129_0918 [Ferrimonas marina]
MKQFFENLGGGCLVVLFMCGYFPISPILAYIYGDKSDVFMSFIIPFWGLFTMIANF